jgi:hypothetical protein
VDAASINGSVSNSANAPTSSRMAAASIISTGAGKSCPLSGAAKDQSMTEGE